MATSVTPSMKQLLLGDVEHELALTRKVLERVPMDQLDYAPHEKSMTLGTLAKHTAESPGYLAAIAAHDRWDIAGPRPKTEMPGTIEQLLAIFDAQAARVREAMAALDDATILGDWSMVKGEQVLQTQPRTAVLRTMGVNHLIHHRGQLSVYLRLCGAKVPSIYGPSADEPAF